MRNGVIIKNVEGKGLGVFATRNFKKGERVVCGKLLYKVARRTSHSFQMGPDYHVQLDKLARSINHSCDPNIGVRNNFYGGYDFITIRKIKIGEEVTWDYATTEYVSIAVKKCLCGSKRCRGTVGGFSIIGTKLKQKYYPFMGDYLKK